MVDVENADCSIDMMIVDDEEMMLDLLVDIFTNDWQNIKLSAFSSSEKAMEQLALKPVDIIITDLMMPHYSGIDILRKAKELYPDVLVVLITAFASLQTTLQALEHGAYDYLTKPFQVQEFELMVKNAVNRIYLQRRLAQFQGDNEQLRLANTELRSELEMLRGRLAQLDYHKAQEGRLLGPHAPIAFDGGKESPAPGELSPAERLTHQPREQLKQELKRLDQLKKKGEISEAEHEQSMREILKTHISS